MKDSRPKETASSRRKRSRRASVDSGVPARTAPEKIGRYQLCFELASGGMARVYLARAEGTPGFQKLVALKRIHPHLAEEKDYVEMFLDEARIASRSWVNTCSLAHSISGWVTPGSSCMAARRSSEGPGVSVGHPHV